MNILFLHSAHLWRTAYEARNRAIAAATKNPNDAPTDTASAIVLSAASAEAFINELTECVALAAAGPAAASLSDKLRNLSSVLEEIESSRGSLTLKYLLAAQTLTGKSFDKGANPYQDFAVLVALRNDLMHLKPRDKLVSIGPQDAAMEIPKYIVGLQQRGIARSPDTGVLMSWFNRLQTAAMAEWATETARAIILAVLAMIPDDPNPDVDPSFVFKSLFRNPPSIGAAAPPDENLFV